MPEQVISHYEYDYNAHAATLLGAPPQLRLLSSLRFEQSE